MYEILNFGYFRPHILNFSKMLKVTGIFCFHDLHKVLNQSVKTTPQKREL